MQSRSIGHFDLVREKGSTEHVRWEREIERKNGGKVEKWNGAEKKNRTDGWGKREVAGVPYHDRDLKLGVMFIIGSVHRIHLILPLDQPACPHLPSPSAWASV